MSKSKPICFACGFSHSDENRPWCDVSDLENEFFQYKERGSSIGRVRFVSEDGEPVTKGEVLREQKRLDRQVKIALNVLAIAITVGVGIFMQNDISTFLCITFLIYANNLSTHNK